ncbi:hypothetical protein Asulf_01524 [Archaeoglobus sulfaticallidus PM70-1]|uniref:Uncharacterized protein n=1 Tax=Archaeoglobus sulfaticallidus PM70-1 TaxID=387631 RepID=N0BGX1_9EURY|nr:hypothetical protein [Archaeoglobus sulfaticallidus]AGK61502.1 hypothetical protein Asulf_01524 [Archaeoglobus sulfaticallidus PM70-1]
MATQEEVLEAIKQKGYADLKDLKRHFGLEYQGSSWLPQRLRALERKGLIVSMRSGNISVYLANDFDCCWDEAKRILLELGLIRKRKRGRPKGSIQYREESITKLLNFIRENKIVTIRWIQRNMGWDWRTTTKYINKLVRDGIVFEIRNGRLRLFTISLI